MIKDRPSGYKYVCLQELLEKLPAVKEGKILADKMIVNCGNCGNWWPEKVFKVVAEQMVMEMVDDKEQEMVNNVALFRTF